MSKVTVRLRGTWDDVIWMREYEDGKLVCKLDSLNPLVNWLAKLKRLELKAKLDSEGKL